MIPIQDIILYDMQLFEVNILILLNGVHFADQWATTVQYFIIKNINVLYTAPYTLYSIVPLNALQTALHFNHFLLM